MGGICTRSAKEHELELEATIEKSRRLKIELEAEFLVMIKNIYYPNPSVQVTLPLTFIAKVRILRAICL